jgi:hypothetical protein
MGVTCSLVGVVMLFGLAVMALVLVAGGKKE